MNAIVNKLMLEVVSEDQQEFDYIDIELLKKVLKELKDNYTKNFYSNPDRYSKNINFINMILIKTFNKEQRKFLYERYINFKTHLDPNY